MWLELEGLANCQNDWFKNRQHPKQLQTASMSICFIFWSVCPNLKKKWMETSVTKSEILLAKEYTSRLIGHRIHQQKVYSSNIDNEKWNKSGITK